LPVIILGKDVATAAHATSVVYVDDWRKKRRGTAMGEQMVS
jgi:hypothetical protein